MPMTAGTVTIADDGTETKTAGSMAEAIFDSFVAGYSADTGENIPAGAEGAPIKKGYAVIATRLSSAIVGHLASNADVRITDSDGGLQTSTPQGNPTNPPASDVVLSGALE